MINNKVLGLIGLSARARKVCFGADSVEQEIKKKKVQLVIVATNSSDRTREKFQKLCESFNIPIVTEYTIEEISKAIGKQNKAVIGLKDENIVNGIQKIIYGGDIIG